MKLFVALTMIGAFGAAAGGVQAARERIYPADTAPGDDLLMTSGPTVRRLSVAYTDVAADLYWIRAIQYYGGTKRRLAARFPGLMPPPALSADPAVDFPLLYPLLDLTTTLDPFFNVAYRFGAIFLAEPYPSGPGRPDLAIHLLEKGLRARADKWEYMQDIGFVHYWYHHDYRAAAQWFTRASQVPGSPIWLKSLAATTLAQGGDRQSSRRMWMAIRESAEVDWLKQYAERSLRQLGALDDLDQLQVRVDAWRARHSYAPVTWRALVGDALVPGIAVDPAGVPYELSPDGRVALSSSSPLWPLPEEPRSTPR